MQVFLLAIIASFFLVVVFAIATLAAVTTVFLHRRLQLFVQHAACFVCRASLHLLHTHLLVLVIAFAVAFAARLLVLLFAFHKLFAKLVLGASLHRGFRLGAWFHIFLVLAIVLLVIPVLLALVLLVIPVLLVIVLLVFLLLAIFTIVLVHPM